MYFTIKSGVKPPFSFGTLGNLLLMNEAGGAATSSLVIIAIETRARR